VNKAEAETIRMIFRRYLELGSTRALRDDLATRKVVSKAWTSTANRRRGGQPYDRGALNHILKNRVYRGEVVHKGSVYEGEHKPIVPQELFDTVQQRLTRSTHERRRPNNTPFMVPLAGLLFDDRGNPMRPAYTR
jgi:hypothetical protein